MPPEHQLLRHRLSNPFQWCIMQTFSLQALNRQVSQCSCQKMTRDHQVVPAATLRHARNECKLTTYRRPPRRAGTRCH